MTGTHAETSRRIHRISLLLIASMLLSRVIGFFREMALAHTLGASSITDVYYTSFTIPDILNHLMAAGALSISFIPILSQFLVTGREELGKSVFRALSTLMGALLILLIIIAEIFTPALCDSIAPGFSGEKKALLVQLVRIILPAQFFFYWGGLLISVQHTYGKFWLPALAPIIYNASTIVMGILFHKILGVTGFSIGILLGAALGQGLVQWYGVSKLGFSIVPYFKINDPEVWQAIRKYLWLSFPIMLGFSVVVADEWISKFYASTLEDRAISWLSYARTEMRIPMAVLGQAAGIASFPVLSRLWAENKVELYGRTFLWEIMKLWALAPIATILMIHFSVPITHFLYGGGKFTPNDLLKTSQSVQIYGTGIFFWTLQMLLSRGCYAMGKTWFPSISGTVLSILFIPLYRSLAESQGYLGLALAGTLGITVYCLWLSFFWWRGFSKKRTNFPKKQFFTFVIGWTGVTVLLFYLGEWISTWQLYQGTRLSAFFEVAISSLLLFSIAWIFLRFVFKKITVEPLY